MRILDLFCGAGGAAMGYYRGFPREDTVEIVGIDIEPQPNYPFEFILADLRTDDPVDIHTFDLIHASPPCQAFSTLRASNGFPVYENLIPMTYAFLEGYQGRWVIENVPGADFEPTLLLCGSMFGLEHDGKQLRRHRYFETSFLVMGNACRHNKPVRGVYGDLSKNERPSNRGVKAGIKQAEALMGIDWMSPQELVQAIPPAYTEHISIFV